MVLLPTVKTAICLSRLSQKNTSTTKHVCSHKCEGYSYLFDFKNVRINTQIKSFHNAKLA